MSLLPGSPSDLRGFVGASRPRPTTFHAVARPNRQNPSNMGGEHVSVQSRRRGHGTQLVLPVEGRRRLLPPPDTRRIGQVYIPHRAARWKAQHAAERPRQCALRIPEVRSPLVGNERARLLGGRALVGGQHRHPDHVSPKRRVFDGLQDGGFYDRGPLSTQRSGGRHQQQQADLVRFPVEGLAERADIGAEGHRRRSHPRRPCVTGSRDPDRFAGV